MSSPRPKGPDEERSRLRATVVAIEAELSRLPRQFTTGNGERPTKRLAESWADLVEQLALGPEPDLRQCPVCKNLGMRSATLCGYCWTELTPSA